MAGAERRATGPSWQDLAAVQAGVVTRAQLLELGLTKGEIDARLTGRRWARLHPGVFVTFTGPVPDGGRVWAALLAAGDDAALGGRTALWLWGVADAPEALITVCIPARRRAVAPSGTRILRRRRLPELVHPVALPRRLRLEEALLDVTDEAPGEDEVVGLVLRATSSRRTTAARVLEGLGRRRQLLWAQGWRGIPRPCRDGCPVGDLLRA